MRVFPSTHARRVPWKNGRGSTLELLTDATEPGGAWTWRLAVADVPEAGPFSSYPDIDRSIVLLEGAGLTLEGARGRRAVPRWGEGLAFAGEEPVTGLPDGAGVQDGNLMLRRGVWTGDVLHLGEGTHALEGAPVLVHAWRGDLDLVLPLDPSGALRLSEGQTLLTSGRVTLSCVGPSRALAARLACV